MELFEAINNRRSIRKYTGQSLEKEVIRQVLQAGIEAPSSKNRQPWRFIVLTGNSKSAILEIIEKRVTEWAAAASAGEKAGIAWVHNSIKIMEQAPTMILIMNRGSKCLALPQTELEMFHIYTDAQSLGAAIQNMTLAATGLGLGSLWICDILFASRGICEWLETDEQPAAVLALGYADEAPNRRPREKLEDISEWR